MNQRTTLIAAAVALVLSTNAYADQQIVTVATGGPTGTYAAFFKSIKLKCDSPSLLLQAKESKGGDDNLEFMINKQADAGFVQTDTLQFVAMNDPRASQEQIKVLVPLYPEEVHVVALAQLSKTSGGWNVLGKNILGNRSSLDSLADLDGVKVGAWGGSYTTARAISYLGGVKYDTVRYDNDKAAKAALDAGEIAAIIAVGGQPLGFAKGLDAKYKLLKIDSSLAGKVKSYQPARISYKNMNADGVETVAPLSMLVVKNYQTPQRKAAFTELKDCILRNESEFKEGTGHHPKWEDVKLQSDTVWAKYVTNQSSAPIPVASPPPVKGKK